MNLFDILYKAAFALGGLSLLVFLSGHAGFLSTGAVLLLSATALVAFVFFARKNLKDAFDAGRACVDAFRREPFSKQEILLFLLAVSFMLAVIPLALTPPIARDELIHHLAAAKLYVERGAIFEIAFMPFTYLPSAIDSLYLIPMAAGNDVIPKLIHLLFGFLSALTVYAYLKPRAGRPYALLGFLIFFSTPAILNASRTAYIDLGVTFFSTLALFGALLWRETNGRKWFYYSAISMGLALSSKYNAAISLFLVAAFIAWTTSREKGGQIEAVRNAAIYVLIALAVFSPLLIRNYIWTGNPFHPVFDIMGGSLHTGGALSPVDRRYLFYGEGTIDVILIPLRIFFEGTDGSIEKFDGVLNPLLLLFILVAFLKRGLKDFWPLAGFAALFFYMAFFTAELVIRYVFPILPPLAVLAAFGVKNSFEFKKTKTVAVVLLAAFFLFNVYYLKGLYDKYRPIAYVTGKESAEEYLSRTLPDYSVINFANKTLPPSAKVELIFAGDRGYYWERPYYYGGRAGDSLIAAVKSAKSGQELKDSFSGRGITHIFVRDALLIKFAGDNFDADKMKVLSDFTGNNLVFLNSANGFSLYGIR
ncbi:MAG: glycosyltransferase family 39 protein [Thermodesulfobacteriota bacterium]